MKAVGIVAEYNPFHSGHRYQIRKIREIFGAETPIAAVMSGDFVQRGEAASYDKFTRAEAAVRGGVSLVIELPLPWSLSSAESFARGGVGLLGAAGVIDALSFGSESGDLSALEKTAAVLDTPEFAEALKRELTGGTPFAAARARAARALLGESAAVLDTPNDLLAVEYIRAAAFSSITTTRLLPCVFSFSSSSSISSRLTTRLFKRLRYSSRKSSRLSSSRYSLQSNSCKSSSVVSSTSLNAPCFFSKL